MDSERRHELEQNKLADAMGNWYKQIAPYGRAIGFGVVGLIAIVIVYSFLTTQREAHQATASLDYLLATRDESPESFNVVSTNYGDTKVADWAQQAQADLFLSQGIDSLYTDRDTASKMLDSAVESYQLVLKTAKDSLLKVRANYGLAKAYESQGEVDKAIETYQVVVDTAGSEGIVDKATERIESLNRKDTREFYAWFKENQPVAMVNDPPTMPSLEGLSDDPDVTLPPVDDLTPGDEDAASETDGDAEPAGTNEDASPETDGDAEPAETSSDAPAAEDAEEASEEVKTE